MEMALVAGNLLVSGSSFSALVPDLSSVEEERNLPVSGSSSFALIPGLALVEVGLLVSAAEKALVAGEFSGFRFEFSSAGAWFGVGRGVSAGFGSGEGVGRK